jgi:hypothetical protein
VSMAPTRVSPVLRAFEALRALDASWTVEIGRPSSGESTFFERTALHEPRGVVIHGCDAGSDQRSVLPIPDESFEGSDLAANMRPRLQTVRYRDCTDVYQRRGSCCRSYLVPEGQLCASCPLLSQEERVARNVAWMKRQIDSPMERRGHS